MVVKKKGPLPRFIEDDRRGTFTKDPPSLIFPRTSEAVLSRI
jgi:hypothetical protein